ncbi:cytochrome c peroxidase [Methylobacter psychrophilus]|uniref:cytochrome c peroxidase n=1 Tax=Methylobacter psychrophilus TaxID=96941 RepID=UPI002948B7D5|nr:cytochrome c peroxidase [Methylobacter psychrophilus]
MKFLPQIMLGFGLLITQAVYAHGPIPYPLQNVPLPPVPGLLDGTSPIVVDKNMAIALGKALFWDMNVGSDGQACGSCHYHAGADARDKNQINPGEKSSNASGQTFDMLPSGTGGGPNYTVKLADFPLYRYPNPLNKSNSVPTYITDDVVSSAGTFSGTFKGANPFNGTNDNCDRSADPVFHIGNTGTRRVEPRNTPTVINDIFNYRNFWDGRANNIFNGSSTWGDRDPTAGIWVTSGARSVVKQRLHLENSSLASLAMGPPLNATEMSCRGRNLAAIGRKLLLRKPLQNQKVHGEDSVFAPLNLTLSTANDLKTGLNTTYKTMITKAFNKKYWSYNALGPFGAPAPGQMPYNQTEANFSLFFGIALQMYQATLISDQAPIDLTQRVPATYVPTWLGLGYSPEKIVSLKNGHDLFISNHCNLCHGGPTITIASVATNALLVTPTTGKTFGPAAYPRAYGPQALGPQFGAQAVGISRFTNVIVRDETEGGPKLMDFGFANTGVADPDSDPGVGGVDDFGQPLSFSAQYLDYLQGNPAKKILDPGVTSVRTCNFIPEVPFATNVPDADDWRFTDVDGLIANSSSQFCFDPDSAYMPTTAAAIANVNTQKMAIANKAAFKIPSLRNVELTGPYMHNGSMATLDEVIEFYSRHGNVDNIDKHAIVNGLTLGSAGNSDVSETQRAKNRADVIAFLKTFTDDRVRYEKAPFDHPEIILPYGHEGNAVSVNAGNPLSPVLAKDEVLVIPAVGANGKADPLLPFDQLIAH